MTDSTDKITLAREGETVNLPTGMVAIIMPKTRAFALRVAIAPRFSGDPTSTEANRTRTAFDRALARLDER